MIISMTTQKPFTVSRSFLVVLGILGVMTIGLKPALKLGRESYDKYKASTTTLTMPESEYQQLLKTIQAQQPKQTLEQPVPQEFGISEKIFQAAIAPDLLGRISQYEPNTSGGTLACAAMVNKVFQKALDRTIGTNTLYVPSMVEAFDNGQGRRLEQSQTRRGDIAIANGTDYENGLWHIGICMTDRCSLVLSNSPEALKFNWLSDANFEGAFDHNPGKTTFYRVMRSL
jgi:hypothetical protein